MTLLLATCLSLRVGGGPRAPSRQDGMSFPNDLDRARRNRIQRRLIDVPAESRDTFLGQSDRNSRRAHEEAPPERGFWSSG